MIETIYNQFQKKPLISTDTRKIEEGCIFFALKGPNFNANTFAEEALNRGAALVVVDEVEYQVDERCVLVEDTLLVLQELAKFHRNTLKIPVIGLTGSNGKTTTKELINIVLSEKYCVLATKGNLNNHIGVPLTLLSINNDHDIAIIEMGANHIGEIQHLCSISQPTHGLITNIGKAHLEGFGGFEGVIRAKSELYHYLIQTNGVVWINSENEILRNMSKRFKSPLFYPSKGDYYHCQFNKVTPYVNLTAENGELIKTKLIGRYNYENIAVALCIGKYFEVADEKANQSIAQYEPSNNRSQIIKQDTNTIILDAYNANPTSMDAALENLKLTEAKTKVAVLGDMKELGVTSGEEHNKIAIKLKELELRHVFLFGDEFKAAIEILPSAFHTSDKVELLQAIDQANLTNALVLIKGSRSMGLEEVVEVI